MCTVSVVIDRCTGQTTHMPCARVCVCLSVCVCVFVCGTLTG